MNKNYNSTLVRVAGNLLSGVPEDWLKGREYRAGVVKAAVATAREIVFEVERTEPAQEKAVTNG